MKTTLQADEFQKQVQCGIQVAGRIFLIGLVVGLVSAWALAGSFYELGKWMLTGRKSYRQNK